MFHKDDHFQKLLETDQSLEGGDKADEGLDFKQKVINLYQSEPKKTVPSSHKIEGKAILDMKSYGPTKIIYVKLVERKHAVIQTYDWVTKEVKDIVECFTYPEADPDSLNEPAIVFELLKDGRMFIADNTKNQLVEMESGTQLAQLGNEEIWEKYDAEDPYAYQYYKAVLIEEDKFVITMQFYSIVKLQLEDNDLQKVCQYDLNEGYDNFNDMQVLESQKKILVSEAPGTRLIELSLDDLSELRVVGWSFPEDNPLHWYSEKNDMILFHPALGNITSAFTTDPELTEFGNAIPINTAEMTNDSAQMLDYPEKNLLFVLGHQGVNVIDLTCKKVVAKFSFDCTKLSRMVLSENGHFLIVQGLVTDPGQAQYICNANIFFHIALKPQDHIDLKVDGGIKNMAQSATDDSLLYITQGQNLRTYNLVTGELGKEMDTGADSYQGPYMICAKKYCFFSDGEEDRMNRVDLKSGERKDFPLSDYTEYMRSMNVIYPKDYPQGLIVFVYCQSLAIEFFDVETLESIYYNKLGEEEQFWGSTIAWNAKQLFFGSMAGVIKTLDISDIKKLKASNNDIKNVKTFYQTDSAIQAFAVSLDEVYVAAGTEQGTIYVFETKLAGTASPYFHLKYGTHTEYIKQLMFIESKDSYLLASYCNASTVKVQCLKENVPLYSYENIAGIKQMLYSQRLNALITCTSDQTAHKIPLNFDHQFLQEYQTKFETDLELNMKRQFLIETEDDTRHAIVKNLSDLDILGLQKINLFSLVAIIGKSDALAISAQKFDMWMTPQGETLIQICNHTNDIDCINVCLEKISAGKGSMNWETLCQIIQERDSSYVSDVLVNQQIVPSQMSEKAQKMLPIKGEIAEDMFTTESPIITEEKIQEVVDFTVKKEDMAKVLFGTLNCQINTTLGSTTCMEILSMLSGGSEKNCAYIQTHVYVDYLWDNNWNTILFYSLLNISQYMLLTLTVIFASDNNVAWAVNAIFSTVMLLLEFRQICSNGCEYLSDPFNYLDLLGNSFVIQTSIKFIIRGQKVVFQKQYNLFFLVIGLLLIGLRALSQFRIFYTLRVLIEVIKICLVEMVNFGAVLLMITFLMTIPTLIFNKSQDDLKDTPNQGFIWVFGDLYLATLGNTIDEDAAIVRWLIFIIFSVLVNITAMNLLIAVLSDAYANTMGSMDSTHFTTKVDIMNEIQDLMFWNRKKNDLHYLHILYYPYEDLNQNTDDPMDGKFESVLSQINEVKEEQKQSTQMLKNEIKNVKEEIKKELTNVIAELKALKDQ